MATELQGVEGRHGWFDLDNTIRLSMNEFGDDLRPESWPAYKIRDIAGLFALPDVEDNSEDETEAIGVRPLPSYVRSKNITYTIDVFGRTAQEMRLGGHLLRVAFGADMATGLNPVRRMVMTAHPLYPVASTQWTYRARCLQAVPGGDTQDRGPNAQPSPFGRNWVVGLRVYDPRIYEWDGLAESAPTW